MNFTFIAIYIHFFKGHTVANVNRLTIHLSWGDQKIQKKKKKNRKDAAGILSGTEFHASGRERAYCEHIIMIPIMHNATLNH